MTDSECQSAISSPVSDSAGVPESGCAVPDPVDPRTLLRSQLFGIGLHDPARASRREERCQRKPESRQHVTAVQLLGVAEHPNVRRGAVNGGGAG